MATDNRLGKVLEFLYKTNENPKFFTKFDVEGLDVDVRGKEIGYNCLLITEHYSFNEYNELAGSIEEAGNNLYNFFKKITLNEKGNFINNTVYSSNSKFDDDFFLGIQVEGLSIDYGSEKVIINWRIAYDGELLDIS